MRKTLLRLLVVPCTLFALYPSQASAVWTDTPTPTATFTLTPTPPMTPTPVTYPGGTVGFKKTILPGSFGVANDIIHGDLDNDGDIDLVAISSHYEFGAEHLSWFENLGNSGFARHDLTNEVSGYAVDVADVDSDGDLDILAADLRLRWYENNGSGSFTAHDVDVNFTANDVHGADVDGDNDTDLVATACADTNQVAWYENNGSEQFTKHLIEAIDDPTTAIPVDLDQDGDMDVVGWAYRPMDFIWWENDGSENFTRHFIADYAYYSEALKAADLDHDGDIDLVTPLTWWENNGSESFTQHTIYSGAFTGARGVWVADIDKDGDLDTASVAHIQDEVAWFENNGSESFTKHTISTDSNGAYAVGVADLNNDWAPDIYSCCWNESEIAWWEHKITFIQDDFNGAAGELPSGWQDEKTDTSFNANIFYSENPSQAVIQRTMDSTWGKVLSPIFQCNVEKYDTIEVEVSQVSASTGWKIGLQEMESPYRHWDISASSSNTGVFTYDYQSVTGLTGEKTLAVEVVIEGAGGAEIEVNRLCVRGAFYTATPTPTVTPVPNYAAYEHFIGNAGQQVSGWLDETQNSAFNAEISYGPGYSQAAMVRTQDSNWGKALSAGITANVDLYPMLEMKVDGLDVDSAWKVGIQEAEGAWRYWDLNSSTNSTGIFILNYQTATGWSGVHTFQVQFVLEGEEGKTLTVDYVRLSQTGAVSTNTPTPTITPTPTNTFTPTSTPTPTDAWLEEFDGPDGQPDGWLDETQNSAFNAEISNYHPTESLATVLRTSDDVWGKVLSEVITCDVSTYNTVEIRVYFVYNATWKIGIQEEGGSWQYQNMNASSSSDGVFNFNYASAMGWSGTHSFRVQIVVEGSGGYGIHTDWVRICREGSVHGSSVGGATCPYTKTFTPTATKTLTPTITATRTATPQTPETTATPTATPTPFVAANQVLPYPNPARGRVYFAYTVAGAAKATIDIYTLAGERVATVTEHVNGGAGQTLKTAWEAVNVAPGVYLCRIVVTDESGRVILNQKKKVALIK